MRVALIHDWLTGMRGGEKVLESFCRIFPGADIYTLFYEPSRVSDTIRAHRICPSALDCLPGSTRFYRYLLPLMTSAVRGFDLRGYDLVLSSSHAVVKGVRVPAGVPHLCYCHTPMRYIWETGADYFQSGSLRRTRALALELLKGWLRRWDVSTAREVTYFVANCENVRRRIASVYGRDAFVVYPPVDTDYFTPGPDKPAPDYWLVVSALESYKRVDVAVSAFNEIGTRLVVAGRGSEKRALERAARPNVRFTDWVSQEQLRELYRGCRGVIVPGREDFGIVPVEAQACGKPVVAFGQGGVRESVLPGITGAFFHAPSAGSLAAAVRDAEKMEFDPDASRRNSLRFSRHNFEMCFTDLLKACLAGFAGPRAAGSAAPGRSQTA